MKSLGISVLVVSLMIQVMSASLILFNYEVNTAYIIENFCVNINKPEMKCDGKCHLTKQIQTDSEQKSETPAALSELITFVLAVEDIETFQLNIGNSGANQCNTRYIQGNYSNHLQAIFHPPQV